MTREGGETHSETTDRSYRICVVRYFLVSTTTHDPTNVLLGMRLL